MVEDRPVTRVKIAPELLTEPGQIGKTESHRQ